MSKILVIFLPIVLTLGCRSTSDWYDTDRHACWVSQNEHVGVQARKYTGYGASSWMTETRFVGNGTKITEGQLRRQFDKAVRSKVIQGLNESNESEQSMDSGNAQLSRLYNYWIISVDPLVCVVTNHRGERISEIPCISMRSGVVSRLIWLTTHIGDEELLFWFSRSNIGSDLTRDSIQEIKVSDTTMKLTKAANGWRTNRIDR